MCTEGDRSTLRQLFILTAGCLLSYASGFMLSFPAVLNPSILAPNSTIHATSDQASWIAASNGFAGILGFFILSPLFQLVGRKYVNFGVSIIMLIGWIILICANSIFHLLCGRIVQGIVVGAYYICAITVSEYCDPTRRGYFMSLKKISQAIGSLSCHSLVLIMNWRYIAAFVSVPVFLSAIFIMFWPESPAFLAMKGKFNECEKSFIWLHGSSPGKLKELKDLINAQSERLEKNKQTSSMLFFTQLLRTFRRKDFIMPFLIVSLLTLAIDACGRYFLLAYLTQIMIEITGNKSIAMYCAVASDFLLISALSASCILIRLFKRRTILFIFGALTTLLMFTISLTIVLKTHFGLHKDFRWLIVCFILLHSFVSHVGLVPTAFTISAEIFPLEHKGLGSFASGVVFTTFYALSLKLTPVMIERTGVAGTYSIYGVCVTICLIFLYFMLPETKDKTLQEIDDEIKGVKRTLESDVLIHNGSDANKRVL